MLSISNSPASQSFKSLLWKADYVPGFSTVKVGLDFLAKSFWKPKDFDHLSSYAKAYFEYLVEKEDSRYIAFVPLFGNAIVLAQDCYDTIIREEQQRTLRNAEQGNLSAIEKLYQGTPEQKTKALECCYKLAFHSAYVNATTAHRFLFKVVSGEGSEQKKNVHAWLMQNIQKFKSFNAETFYNWPNLPQELRIKIVDVEVQKMLQRKDFTSGYLLRSLLTKTDIQDKKLALAMVTKAAELGNEQAFDYIKDELRHDPFLFQWVVKQAETFSSPVNRLAWECLEHEYYTGQAEKVVDAYLKLLQIPGLSKDRYSHIVKKLDVRAWTGTSADKAQILAGYLKVAESGNAKMMCKVARIHQEQGQEQIAMHWFEKGANANHLSSILETAKRHAHRGDIQAATFWLNKAQGRCHSPMKMSMYRLVEAIIRCARNTGPSAGFYSSGTRSNAQQRPHYQYSQGGARAEMPRAQTNKEKAAAMKPGLVRIFGEFSTVEELHKKWTKWCLKAHPDKGGPEEEFKRVTNLVEVYKMLSK